MPAEGAVSSARLFGDAEGHERPLHFEIGFGGGEHLAFRAALLPDHGFIGAELSSTGSPRRWSMSATARSAMSACTWATRSKC